jgi:hypothetical protein
MPPAAASSASSQLLLLPLAMCLASAASLGCKALKIEGACWLAALCACVCCTCEVEASSLLQGQTRQQQQWVMSDVPTCTTTHWQAVKRTSSSRRTWHKAYQEQTHPTGV